MDPPYVLPIELLLCELCELRGFFFYAHPDVLPQLLHL